MVEPSGAELLVIENNPVQARDPIECLARLRSSAECSVSSDIAIAQIERLSAAEVAGFSSIVPTEVFRVSELICNTRRCEVEIDGVVTYADADHLSFPFVMRHRPEIERFLMDALEGSP